MSLRNLYKAIEKIESGGNPNAVSSKGARGLMQVMPSTARKPGYGVKPAKNESKEEYVRVGKDYAKAMYRKFNGDIEAVLAAYNMGPGATEKWIEGGRDKSKLPRETKNYIPKVKKELITLNKKNQGRVQMAGVLTKVPELFKSGSRIYSAISPRVANLLRGKGFVKLTAKQAAKQAGKAQKITEQLAKKLDSKGIPQVPVSAITKTASKVKKIPVKRSKTYKDWKQTTDKINKPKPKVTPKLKVTPKSKVTPKLKVTPKSKVTPKTKTQTNKQTQKNRNKEAVKQAKNNQGQNVIRNKKKEDPFKRMAKVTSTAKPKKPLSTFQKYKPGLIGGTIGGLGGAAVLNQFNKNKAPVTVNKVATKKVPDYTPSRSIPKSKTKSTVKTPKKIDFTAGDKIRKDRKIPKSEGLNAKSNVKKLPSYFNNSIFKKEIKERGGREKFEPDTTSGKMSRFGRIGDVTTNDLMAKTVYRTLDGNDNRTAAEEKLHSQLYDVAMKRKGGKVSKKKGGMVKRSYGGKVKRNMGGMVSPRKKVVFRRGGGRALRGMGKAIYSNKMY